MLVWGVIGLILLLVILFLLLPLSVDVSIRETQTVLQARFAFFRFDFSPEAMAKREKRKKTRRKKKRPQKAKEPEPRSKKTAAEIISLMRVLIKVGLKRDGFIRRHLIISNVRVWVSVGGENAHEAALRFAKTRMAVAAALDLIGVIFVLKKPDVCIAVNYLRPNTRCELRFHVSIRLLFILAAVLQSLRLAQTIRHKAAKAAVEIESN